VDLGFGEATLAEVHLLPLRELEVRLVLQIAHYIHEAIVHRLIGAQTANTSGNRLIGPQTEQIVKENV
jgi:hypothetical protein